MASDAEWRRLSGRTLAHYDQRAVSFWEGTRDHDVSQNYAALLEAIEGKPPFSILDFGCGPGRDLAYFKSQGHAPTGLDGSASFAAMARAHSGCPVLHQNFLELALPSASFHGIFANASLFHVPSAHLRRVLGELRAALKPRGVLFSSNPRGENEEGFNGERYGCYWNWPTWRGHLIAAGFQEIRHYYRPDGLQLAQQSWLASVWRRDETVEP